jgi:hypothetical protein
MNINYIEIIMHYKCTNHNSSINVNINIMVIIKYINNSVIKALLILN